MEEKKGFVKEFKEFIMRGNVLDMAVGVIIATAFGKITTSLVKDVFMPFISWIFGARDMTALNIVVREAVTNEAGDVVKEAIVIASGFLCPRSNRERTRTSSRISRNTRSPSSKFSNK